MMKTELFDYDLPEDLVAAVPAERREQARLLVLDRGSGAARHRRFHELPGLLDAGDVLVVNDARVLPARLAARRATGGAAEILLVRREGGTGAEGEPWLAMVSGSARLHEGETLVVEGSSEAITLRERKGDGYWVVSLEAGAAEGLLGSGWMPLPPYVRRARRRLGMPERMPELDRDRYQTVFARRPGAVAAPTAGLHFTEDLLARVRQGGVEVCVLSLMVGPGTFRPVRSEDVEEHRLEAEFFHLPGETARAVEDALREGRRVIATGTTTCRVLEYVARTGRWAEQSGWTDLYIHPPFEFRVVGGLITNFHLPRSTLLMLVSAFAGRERVLAAYAEAVRERYRFYSYGDAMFVA